MVPIRVCPRNLVMQTRSRIVDPVAETVEEYQKPRATLDLSSGDKVNIHTSTPAAVAASLPPPYDRLPASGLPTSPNAGVPAERTAIALPSAVGIGACIGIVDHAARSGGHPAAAYAVDISNAYPTLPEQQLDWWMQCFLWDDGIHIAYRVTFGGASFPQGFSRVLAVPAWVIRTEIEQFEATTAPPPGEAAWVRRREELQRSQRLPPEREQTRPWNFRLFLDDITGAASSRRTSVPAHLQHIAARFDATLTRSVGGDPFPTDSHAAVHMYIVVWVLQRLGFTIAVEKTMGGDIIVSIGLRMDVRRQRIDCPLLKRASLLQTARAMATTVDAAQPLDVLQVERLVGRAGNLSQIYPAVLLWIHAGYAIAHLHSRQRRTRVRRVQLRTGGRRATELSAFLDVLAAAVEANEGIPMVHSPEFPSTAAAGSLLQVTDASGDDGAGGYAFHADRPGVVFVVHTEWPPEVRAALASAGRSRALRARDASRAQMLSVPAAELATSWLVPYVVAHRTGLPVTAVTAVGDCLPVARALTAGTSPSPQTRVLLRAAYEFCGRWLALAVRRGRNGSADELTHPALAPSMVARARAAGLSVELLAAEAADIPAEVWGVILAAARTPMGGESDAVTVSHRRSPTESSTPVPLTRPGALGNPFAVLHAGKLVEEWRDPCCDAFEWAFEMAMQGSPADLQDIADLFGLPLGSVAAPYRDTTWEAYSDAVRASAALLLSRALGGERLFLTCVCCPRRCHATCVCGWLRQSAQ